MSEQSTQHEIQRLAPRHYKIMDLALAGYRTKDIAQALSMTPQSISLIMNAPLFQHELSRRQTLITADVDQNLSLAPMRAKELIDANLVKAVQTHVDLLDNDGDPAVR